MMKNRFVCLALCLVMLLALVLTSCSSDDGASTDVIVNEVESKSLTMWLVSENEVSPETASAINDAINEITHSRFRINMQVHFLTRDEYEDVLSDTIRAYEDSRNELDPSYVPTVEETKQVVTDASGTGTMIIEETVTNEYGVVTTKFPAFRANQVDIIYIAGEDMYNDYVEKGWLYALDSELSSSSKKIREYVSQTLLNAVKVGNTTYAIPNNNTIGEYTYMLLDKELMEEFNLDGLYNQGEINGFYNEYVFDLLKNVKKNAENLKDRFGDVLPVNASYDYCLNLLAHYWSINPDIYAAEENTFSFLGYHYTDPATLSRGETILSFDSLFADESFNENYIELNRLKFDGGYFGDLAEGQRAAVQFVTGDLSDYEKYSEDYYPVIVKYPSVDVEDVYSDMFGVCTYSVDPSRSMQIVTYLNTNADFRNLLQYGIENTHYHMVEKDGRTVVERLNEDYMMDIFATGNAFIAYPEPTMSPDVWEVGTQQNRQALIEPLLDFDFLQVAKESGATSTSSPTVGTAGYTYSFTTGYSKEILSQDPVLREWLENCDASGSGVYVLHTSSTSGQNVTGYIYYYNNGISNAAVNVTDGGGAISVDYTGTAGSGEELTVISYYGRKNASKLNWNATVNGEAVTTSVTYRNQMINFDFMNTEGYSITYNPEMTKAIVYSNPAVMEWINGIDESATTPYVMRYSKTVGDQIVYTYLVYVPSIANPYAVTVHPTGGRAHLVLDISYTADTETALGEDDIQYALFAVSVVTDTQVEDVTFNLSMNGSAATATETTDVDPGFGVCGNLDTELVRFIAQLNAKITELLNGCENLEELEILVNDLKVLLTPLTPDEIYQKTNTGDFSTMLSELQNAELKAYMETQDTEEFFFSIARATSHEQLTRKGSDSEGAVVDVTEIAALGEPYPTYSSPYMLYYEWLNSNGFIKKD